MEYRMNISKNMNLLTVEILNKNIPEDMIQEFKENNILHDENIIHFRMDRENTNMNQLMLFPKAISIIGKYEG